MNRQRVVIGLAFLTLASTFVAFAAMGTAGRSGFGSGGIVAARLAMEIAIFVGFPAAFFLYVQSLKDDAGLDPVGQALVRLIIAMALTVPSAWAFTAAVSTAEDDSTGCGSILEPNKVYNPNFALESRQTPTCIERLREQKFLAAGLLLPSVLIASVAVVGGVLGTGRGPARLTWPDKAPIDRP